MDRSAAFVPLAAAAATCGTTPARLRRWAGLLRIPLFHPDGSRETMLRQCDLPRLPQAGYDGVASLREVSSPAHCSQAYSAAFSLNRTPTP
jgi:hypothetical protein